MGLTYHFSFRAAGESTSGDLAGFLREVETEARSLGFSPTFLLDGPFDTAERVQFARRLTTGLPLEDPRLKDAQLSNQQAIWFHNPETGTCRVAPEYGVVLILTDERKMESVLGFFRYPLEIVDDDHQAVMNIPDAGDWMFSEFLKTPDQRYRILVRKFAEAGYLALEHDDYRSAPKAD